MMRRAMDGLLPDEVRWRARQGEPEPQFQAELSLRTGIYWRNLYSNSPESSKTTSTFRRYESVRRCTRSQCPEADALTVFGAVVLGSGSSGGR